MKTTVNVEVKLDKNHQINGERKYIAIHDEAPIGHIRFRVTSESAIHITELYVEPDFDNSGIRRILFSVLEAEAKVRHKQILIIFSFALSDAKFYIDNGFIPIMTQSTSKGPVTQYIKTVSELKIVKKVKHKDQTIDSFTMSKLADVLH